MDTKKAQQIVESVLQKENAEKEALMLLLDQQRHKQDHVLAIRSRMGETNSYITSVPFSWVAANVKFAVDLPIWAGKKDKKTGHLVIDEDTADELRQREPDWRRQIPMVQYLALRKNHKFPPILVAAWKDWVNNPESDEWGQGGSATENSVSEQPLDSDGVYLDLDCEKSKFYALDGQHRLMAIRGFKELLDNRKLFSKKWNQAKEDFVPDVKSGGITLDETISRLNEIHKSEAGFQAGPYLQALMDESIGIEIIPAVQKGETKDSALARLRSIFVHINMTAKKLTKGQLAQLNEDDGFAIVARRLMVTHSLLKHNRVDTSKGQLRDTSDEFTTLETLVEITKKYLSSQFPDWGNQKEKGVTPIRPEDDEIDAGVEKMAAYFNALAELDSHRELLTDQNKSCKDYRQKDKNENILFRPMTQIALATAISTLERDKGMSLESIINKLRTHEIKGDLRLREATSIWYGVLCDVNNMKMQRKEQHKVLCEQLFVHLLGGGTPEGPVRGPLEKAYQEARAITKDAWMNLDGKSTDNSSEISLPNAW